HGRAAIDAMTRDLVSERLKPYLKDINKVGSREYEEVIRNLSPLIGEERTNLINQRLKEARSRQAQSSLVKRKITTKGKPFQAKKGEIHTSRGTPNFKEAITQKKEQPFKAEKKEIRNARGMPNFR